MGNVLPSTRTLQGRLLNQRANGCFPSPTLGFDESQVTAVLEQLKALYMQNSWPLFLVIGEDASSVSQDVRVKNLGDKSGIVYGLDINSKCTYKSKEELDEILDNFKTNAAKSIYVYTVSHPFVIGVPSFVLAFFGTANRFNTDEVIMRWNILHRTAKRLGFRIVCHSSDGDSRCMAAMRQRHGQATVKLSPGVDGKIAVTLSEVSADGHLSAELFS